MHWFLDLLTTYFAKWFLSFSCTLPFDWAWQQFLECSWMLSWPIKRNTLVLFVASTIRLYFTYMLLWNFLRYPFRLHCLKRKTVLPKYYRWSNSHRKSLRGQTNVKTFGWSGFECLHQKYCRVSLKIFKNYVPMFDFIYLHHSPLSFLLQLAESWTHQGSRDDWGVSFQEEGLE